MPSLLSSRLFTSHGVRRGHKGSPQIIEKQMCSSPCPWVTRPTIITTFGTSMRHHDEMMIKERRTCYCTSGNLTAMSPDCVIYRTQGSEGYCNYAHELRVSPPIPANYSSHSLRQRCEICRSSAFRHIKIEYPVAVAQNHFGRGNRMRMGLCAAAHGPQ